MHLSLDLPVGRPSFELSEDQLATVVDLLCQGVAAARPLLEPGMLENPITNHVKKAMRRLKKQLNLSNLEITGEFELLNLSNDDPEVLGRIDIILRFLHQFGDEEAYLGVECKRVGHGESALNQRYVTKGVDRFVTGQYAAGHLWGIMLGYVLRLPNDTLVKGIDARIRSTYGETAGLGDLEAHAEALSMHSGELNQGAGHHVIQLMHIFVDATPAAPEAAATTAAPAVAG
ncbi:hypothetical protein J6350_11460 [Burkholderia pseudomallei]|uniref:hypothetical protein n=1 Tax=Burkholderia pseudomallei TaxID=28450 RepID=UPI001A9E4D0D|nr:hypothetical protein [Burkholderia pseudomallei]MBO2953959.1 hypothetical protein [Burkholderia pseudomallei]MBO3033487.1 hypothetical protein [Burkholderia pseudomallei]MBO3050710.1 hypothetical protein [Burkholderia pseudomallei]MBO7789525.1 hypothetical protein [Burkholderia pseudomallei]MBO7845743.1 hypothetical protein [Burkholderia pseudomallei]